MVLWGIMPARAPMNAKQFPHTGTLHRLIRRLDPAPKAGIQVLVVVEAGAKSSGPKALLAGRRQYNKSGIGSMSMELYNRVEQASGRG